MAMTADDESLGDYIRIDPLGRAEPDIAAAPAGALRVRFDPGKGSWSIGSHAATALGLLALQRAKRKKPGPRATQDRRVAPLLPAWA